MSLSKRRPLFAHKVVTHRLFYTLLLLVSVIALYAAWYLQNVRDLAPCPLCIMQRFGFWALGLFAFFGVLKGSLGRVSHYVVIILGLLSVSVAVYHNWVLFQPAVECGFDPIQNWVNMLPTARLWPDMFMSTGMCGAKLPLILGVNIPQWSLIGLLGLTLGFIWRLIRR